MEKTSRQLDGMRRRRLPQTIAYALELAKASIDTPGHDDRRIQNEAWKSPRLLSFNSNNFRIFSRDTKPRFQPVYSEPLRASEPMVVYSSLCQMFG